jgi:capsular exopolysaccharide synthesis family protein
MTRLKDALDKAAAHPQTDSEPVRAGQFSHPPHVVPDVWHFEGGETAVPAAVEVATPQVEPVSVVESCAPMPPVAAAAPVSVVSVVDVDEFRVATPPTVAAAPTATPSTAAATPANGDESRRSKLDFWATYKFGDKGIGKVVVGPQSHHGLAEQYRRLGAALHHLQLQTGARTLMVTSAVASEGKTLTSTNLALTLSHSYQRRVLLIDADLRRPSIHEILRLPNSVGLSDSLRHPERGALRFHTISPNLFALTAGRPDSDPMAGLVSDTMNRILVDAAQQFDWVIVDTPPVAMLPDANLLAAMIDTALLVVGAHSTPYPIVRRAVEAIGEQRILGVVLNRMTAADMVAGYNYYGYGHYAYGLAKKSGRRFLSWKKKKPVEKAKQEIGVS